jgi:hypothetical protein
MRDAPRANAASQQALLARHQGAITALRCLQSPLFPPDPDDFSSLPKLSAWVPLLALDAMRQADSGNMSDAGRSLDAAYLLIGVLEENPRMVTLLIAHGLREVTAELLRNTLKLATAAFLTAAIAVWTDRIAYVWYPVLAVVIVVDDNDDHTLQAATGRIMGTILGGLITFLVHTVLSGWIGVLVSMLLMVPMLQLLGWQSALGTAGITSIMFLMIPTHVALNWDYVFNRGLDTVVGCLVGIGVGLLFWPRNARSQMEQQQVAHRIGVASVGQQHMTLDVGSVQRRCHDCVRPRMEWICPGRRLGASRSPGCTVCRKSRKWCRSDAGPLASRFCQASAISRKAPCRYSALSTERRSVPGAAGPGLFPRRSSTCQSRGIASPRPRAIQTSAAMGWCTTSTLRPITTTIALNNSPGSGAGVAPCSAGRSGCFRNWRLTLAAAQS